MGLAQGSGVWWPSAGWASAPGGPLSLTSPPLLPPGSAPLRSGSLGVGCSLVCSFRSCLCCKIPAGGIALSWLPSHGARKAAPEPGLWEESWQRQGEEAAGGPREPCASSRGQPGETRGPGARPVLSNMATTSPMWLFKFHLKILNLIKRVVFALATFPVFMDPHVAGGLCVGQHRWRTVPFLPSSVRLEGSTVHPALFKVVPCVF